jgi:hypothetical protein
LLVPADLSLGLRQRRAFADELRCGMLSLLSYELFCLLQASVESPKFRASLLQRRITFSDRALERRQRVGLTRQLSLELNLRAQRFAVLRLQLGELLLGAHPFFCDPAQLRLGIGAPIVLSRQAALEFGDGVPPRLGSALGLLT